jgi:hypothetical protein
MKEERKQEKRVQKKEKGARKTSVSCLRCCIFVFFTEPIWFHVGHGVHVVSDAGEFVHKGFEHG